MNTIESARSFLDRQTDVAVWYAEYQGFCEAIVYANNVFSQTFNISVEKILLVRRYHLVNPPDTPEHVIEQYKEEDRVAIRDGCFFARSPLLRRRRGPIGKRKPEPMRASQRSCVTP